MAGGEAVSSRHVTMSDDKVDVKPDTHNKSLLHVAVIAWLASFALPGVAFENESIPGFLLLLSIPIAWWIDGWAVYANIFFLWIAKELAAGRRPAFSVVAMLLLAATAPWCIGHRDLLNSSHIDPIVGWGWGAIVWGFSLLVLSATALARLGIGEKNAWVLVALFASVAPISLYVRNTQWHAANEQERKTYLRWTVAFTRVELCGIRLTQAVEIPNRDGVLAALDMDPKLQASGYAHPRVHLPDFAVFRESGYDWVDYSNAGFPGDFRVASEILHSRPLLEARKTGSGAVLRLTDGATNKIVYEQVLREVKREQRTDYCPSQNRQIENVMSPGYDGVISGILGKQLQAKKDDSVISKELSRTRCDLEQLQISDGWLFGLLDGRRIRVAKNLLDYASFCSDSYVGLANSRLSEEGAQKIQITSVYVLDRKSLKPLATFSERTLCKEYCFPLLRNKFKGLQFQDQKPILETTEGDITLSVRNSCINCMLPNERQGVSNP